MLVHEMAFLWADGCPKTYTDLLQDLLACNGLPLLTIPLSPAAGKKGEHDAVVGNELCSRPLSTDNGTEPQIKKEPFVD